MVLPRLPICNVWEAMTVLGDVQSSSTRGGHVHNKRITFAVAAYEKYVATILPQTRRVDEYCQPNSEGSQCRLNFLLQQNGRNRAWLQSVASELQSLQSARKLCDFM
ncbi:uncharacterized protein B0H64DRAFT_432963 [Chaetomium fimeti]|uniref:Uncharacterized protein n=1 Tax=Chaetomium fimeti TaxID=1854472 RepID=A0AAE0HHH2_9PEZI|nr:hypothetical protein B0H64DRAFT_432963 [Chaetomium fimeti]